MKKFIPILTLMVLLLALTGCESEGPKFYTVTFDTDGAIVETESQTVKSGGKVIEPKDPAKENSMFKEWQLYGVKYDFSSPVTSDITLKAVYSSMFTVSFDTDVETEIIESQTVEYGNRAIEPKEPSKENAVFKEWTLDDAKYDFSSQVTKDIKLKAVYDSLYTITFNSNGGTSVPSQVVLSGEKVIAPKEPTKKNTSFKEWVKVDGSGTVSWEAYNFNDPVTEDFTLQAVYYDTHKVTIWSTGGGELQNDVQYVNDGEYAIEPKTPVNSTKWGFKEWVVENSDGTTSTFDFATTKITSDLTIKAVYYEKRTVTFKNADGGIYSTQTVKDGTKATRIDAPSKSGAWSFKSWVIEGKDTEYDFNSPVVEDITLVPTYINGYTVKFDSDGGTYTPSDQFIKEKETASEPKSPDKGGTKGFLWWTKDGSYYDFNTPVTSDITLKAVYWPASSPGEETYDKTVVNMKDEVRCLHNIVRTLISPKENNGLMEGKDDVATIFGLTDKGSTDTVRYLLTNLRMTDGVLIIDDTNYNISNVSTQFLLDAESLKNIKKNATEKKTMSDYTVKYSVDIEELAFKVKCYIGDEKKEVKDFLYSILSVKGTVIKHSEDRYEYHLQLTIENDGYTTTYLIHAGAIKAGNDGDDNILFFNYMGYTGYIPGISLW